MSAKTAARGATGRGGDPCDRKHDHVVPLSRQAVAVLRSLPVLQSEFVFPSTTNESAATGWRKKKDALDATLRKQGAVMPDWVLHDLRRTMATKMPDLDIPVEALSRILNHAPVGITDTNYNHNRYLKPMREALDRWGNRVAELTTPPPVAVPVAAAIPTTDDATFADLVTA